jgi:membrane peptidoglycan carboxypeptidase
MADRTYASAFDSMSLHAAIANSRNIPKSVACARLGITTVVGMIEMTAWT